MIKCLYHFKELPFCFTTNYSPNNGNLPNVLPFSIGVDEKTGRIVQCPDILVSENLEKAYKEGSLVTGYMDEDGIGRNYADDFLDFIISEVGRETLHTSRILEIGCGTGYLLYCMKQLGANVLGVEPGPQGQYGSERFGIDIVHGYFPSEKISGKFDLIIQYAVLEHIENPEYYLDSLRTHLTPRGKIVVAVPSCDEQIKNGDISMFFHEHWSYFTQTTLTSTIENAGYRVQSSRKAGFGGVWYAVADLGLSPSINTFCIPDNNSDLILRIERNQRILESLLLQASRDNRSIGFYCPGRIVNSLSILRLNIDFTNLRIRFFDDNKLIQNHYYPSFPYIIENRTNLLDKQVDELIIASWTFGEYIQSSLLQDGYNGRITTFKEMVA
ncbi:MAG: class I SAM-dependent methyltransferase [Smithellaceae bacterium]